MASIGSLVAALVADTKQWTAGLTVAGSAMSAFQGKTVKNRQGVVASLNKMRNAFLAMAAVKEVFGQISAAMTRLDQVAKKSDLLGVPIENMQGLGFAAEQTGVSVNQLQMGLQRMTRRVAQAAQGQGEAVKALQDLGLSASELNRLSPDQQLRRIADAMQNVEGQSNKVATAFKLFDSEGVALLNTISGGSQALDDFQKQAEELGLVVSREDAKAIEDANDAINRMSKAWEGVVNQLTVAVAPAVEAIADVITGIITGLKDVAQGLRNVTDELGLTNVPDLVESRFRAAPRQQRAFRGLELAQIQGRIGLAGGAQIGRGRFQDQQFGGLFKNLSKFGRGLGEAAEKMFRHTVAVERNLRAQRELADAEPGIAIRNARASLDILRDRLVALDRQTPRLAQAPAPGGGTSNVAIAQQIAQFSQPLFTVQNQQLEVERKQLNEQIAAKMVLIQIQKSLVPEGVELN